MSLILEALRKSEAERRRAQMPDLLTEPQAATPVAVRTPQRWPWVMGGAVLVLGALWFATRGTSPAPVASVAPVEDAAPRVQPAPGPAPVRTTASTARVSNVPSRPLVIAPPAPPAPATASARSDTAPASIAAAAPAPAPPEAIRAEPPSIPASPAPFDDVARITDLGSEERKQLPPLKLSMHMWNNASAQRFVIIDGARLGVGDRLGALVIADILPDGVLLDWNGRALKLPLR